MVRRFAPAYNIREITAVSSANSWIIEVCSITSWAIAVSRPSLLAPRRMCWIVDVR